MSSIADSGSQCICTHPLQGVGAWALSKGDKAGCDTGEATEVSVEVSDDSHPEFASRHTSVMNSHKSGQDTDNHMSPGRQARDIEQHPRYPFAKSIVLPPH